MSEIATSSQVMELTGATFDEVVGASPGAGHGPRSRPARAHRAQDQVTFTWSVQA